MTQAQEFMEDDFDRRRYFCEEMMPMVDLSTENSNWMREVQMPHL